MLNEIYFKATDEYTQNTFGTKARIVQFHMKDLDDFRIWLEKVCNCVIESEKSREKQLEYYRSLIEKGTYSYYHDEDHGTPFSELPEEAQNKIGYNHNNTYSKWSKWTPEKLVEYNGWHDGEIYWFSILDSRTDRTYQLILKEGDWVTKMKYRPNVFTCGEWFEDAKSPLPDFDNWEQISLDKYKRG